LCGCTTPAQFRLAPGVFDRGQKGFFLKAMAAQGILIIVAVIISTSILTVVRSSIARPKAAIGIIAMLMPKLKANKERPVVFLRQLLLNKYPGK